MAFFLDPPFIREDLHHLLRHWLNPIVVIGVSLWNVEKQYVKSILGWNWLETEIQFSVIFDDGLNFVDAKMMLSSHRHCDWITRFRWSLFLLLAFWMILAHSDELFFFHQIQQQPEFAQKFRIELSKLQEPSFKTTTTIRTSKQICGEIIRTILSAQKKVNSLIWSRTKSERNKREEKRVWAHKIFLSYI